MHPSQYKQAQNAEFRIQQRRKAEFSGITPAPSKREAKRDHVTLSRHRAWHCTKRNLKVKASNFDWM